MEKNLDYRSILRLEYENRKARNRYYSLRAFAKSLNLSSGALSEILQGKRNLSSAKAQAIALCLNFDEDEVCDFLKLVEEDKEKSKTPKAKTETLDLSLEMFEIISSVSCMSIISMGDLEDFSLEPHWISKRLSIPLSEVAQSLDKMEKVGLLEEFEGKRRINPSFIFSPDGISSRAVKNYHHQILDLAHEAIEEQSVEQREFRGISFAMDPDDLPKLKKEIFKFQKRIVEKYQKGKKKEVYHFESALFSLTRGLDE